MADYEDLYKSKRLEEVQAGWRRLAKRADQRLVRLEKMAQQSEYRDILQYAYRKAMYDIKSFGGEKAQRFNIQKPKTLREAKMRIRSLERFLEAKTSTRAYIKSTLGKVTDTINTKFNTNFSAGDFDIFARSGMLDRMKADYGSKTTFRTIGYIQRNRKAIDKAIDEARRKHLAIGKTKTLNSLQGMDPVIKEFISSEFRKNGIKVKDMQ